MQWWQWYKLRPLRIFPALVEGQQDFAGEDAMRRSTFWGSLGLATVACISPAQAGWNEFWARFKLDTARNTVYPEPFVTADREIVRNYWEQTEANGWRLQNTLGNFLFDETTSQLNTAGERKIRWILSSAPAHRRQIFVLRAENQAQSAQRLAAVQEFVSQIVGDGALPPVVYTDHDAPGIPGEYLNNIDQQYWKTMPAPRLPSAVGGGAGGGAGAGAGS